MKLSHDGLDFRCGTWFYFQDHHSVDPSGQFHRIGDVEILRSLVVRERGRVTFDEEAPALLQGPLRGSREVFYVEIRGWPDRRRGEWASVRRAEKYQGAPDGLQHATLER